MTDVFYALLHAAAITIVVLGLVAFGILLEWWDRSGKGEDGGRIGGKPITPRPAPPQDAVRPKQKRRD